MLFRQYFIILLLILLVSPNALADYDNDDEDEDEPKILGIDAEDLGNISLYLMVGTLILIVWKPTFIWLRKYGPDRLGQEPRDFKRKLGIFNRKFMKVHIWLGFGTAIIGSKAPGGILQQSCIRGKLFHPCYRCWKCFRKELLNYALGISQTLPNFDEMMR